MSREDVEIVRAAFEAGINRDPRLESTWRWASQWLDPGFEYREDPSWPGAGSYTGIDAFREAAAAYYEVLSEMHFKAEEFIDAGDRVLVLMRWKARGRSGIEAEMEQAGIFTVKAGKVASWQVVLDWEEARRLLSS
jgi:ketosteroid isomerase-like protein